MNQYYLNDKAQDQQILDHEALNHHILNKQGQNYQILDHEYQSHYISLIIRHQSY